MAPDKPRHLIITIIAVIAVVALTALAAACTGPNSEDDLSLSTIPTTPPPTTPTTQTSSTTATTDPGPSPQDSLKALWTATIEATALPADQRPAAIEALGNSISAEVASTLPNLLSETETARVTTYPILEYQIDDTVKITDCALYLPQVVGAVNHAYTATAKRTNTDDWTITTLQRIGTRCIPTEINQAALADYQKYVEALKIYWDPPDPDHPLVFETLTGDFRTLIRGRLAEYQSNGWSSRSTNDQVFPEVIDVFAPDWVLISDCRVIGPDSGRYDTEGNKLTNNGEPIPEGYQDLYRVEMFVEEGQWKARAVDGTPGSDCQQAPTPAGLAVVG